MIVRCIIIIIIVRSTTTRQWGFLQSQRHVERSWFQVGHCIRKYKRSHRCEFLILKEASLFHEQSSSTSNREPWTASGERLSLSFVGFSFWASALFIFGFGVLMVVNKLLDLNPSRQSQSQSNIFTYSSYS